VLLAGAGYGGQAKIKRQNIYFNRDLTVWRLFSIMILASLDNKLALIIDN